MRSRSFTTHLPCGLLLPISQLMQLSLGRARIGALRRVGCGTSRTQVRMNSTEWTGANVRKAFIEFFESKNHKLWPSSAVVPVNDPTLLFSNAGELAMGQQPPRIAASGGPLSGGRLAEHPSHPLSAQCRHEPVQAE